MKQHAVVLAMRAEPDDYPHLWDMGSFLSFQPLRWMDSIKLKSLRDFLIHVS